MREMNKMKLLTLDTSPEVPQNFALCQAPPDCHRYPSQALSKHPLYSASSLSALPTSTPESTSHFGKSERDAWPETVRSIRSVNFQARFSLLGLLRDFLLLSYIREGV